MAAKDPYLARMIPTRHLEYVALVLAVLVAYIHLLHPQYGFPRLLVYLRLGAYYDPRPIAFTISGLMILAGIILAYNGVAKKPIYGAGIVLIVTYFVGYGVWHTVLEHGAFWPYIEPSPHTEGGPLSIIALHLLQNPIALISKVTEAVLLVALARLYRTEQTASSTDELT